MELSEAAKNLKLGIHEHFKGKRYEVIGVVHHSETSEEMVLYKHLDDDGGLWVRPLKMFTEEVDCNGQKVPRFKKI